MITSWDIYEIVSNQDTLHGVMLRGRIRKFAIENDLTCLVENASDKENVVRFALLKGEDAQKVSDFVKTLLSDARIEGVLKDVQNPVLSKLKVNDLSRYSI